MDSSLLAKTTQTVYEGEGGSYYAWSSAEFPILSDAKLGGGILTLTPFALALPHYADSSKVGYVTQGSGRVGMLLSGASEEKVLQLKKGDMIPVPLGATSWWFNDGSSTEFTVVFLGDTSKAHNPGNFTYFFLAGALGMFNGLSTEILTSALSTLSEEETTKIVKSQAGALVVILKEEQNMPVPSKKGIEHMVYNAKVKTSGRLVVTKEKLGLLGEVGLSTSVVKIHKNAVFAPEYSSDSAFQVNYIVKGSGRVQVVGMGGQNVLDETVKAGELFIVPSFFVVSVIAGEEGMEWFSIFTTQKPVFSQLAGRTSVWRGLAPEIVQASLNISPELEERLRSKDVIFPEPN